MLLRFSVENYLSFKNNSVLDFSAASIKEYKENVFHLPFSGNEGVLKSIGIFGHNASGKTNLIRAISFVKNLVLNSSRESIISKEIPREPFLLSTETDTKPSTFEIVILLDGIRYRYGFSVNAKS